MIELYIKVPDRNTTVLTFIIDETIPGYESFMQFISCIEPTFTNMDLKQIWHDVFADNVSHLHHWLPESLSSNSVPRYRNGLYESRPNEFKTQLILMDDIDGADGNDGDAGNDGTSIAITLKIMYAVHECRVDVVLQYGTVHFIFDNNHHSVMYHLNKIIHWVMTVFKVEIDSFILIQLYQSLRHHPPDDVIKDMDITLELLNTFDMTVANPSPFIQFLHQLNIKTTIGNARNERNERNEGNEQRLKSLVNLYGHACCAGLIVERDSYLKELCSVMKNIAQQTES